jgi:hypothetical protein
MKKKHLLLFVLFPIFATAQIDTSKSSLSFSGYAEIYYCYDFNVPENHTRPSFLYSQNRSNEFNLNLGFLKANYFTDRVRANMALAAGTYMNANYATEPGVLKNIYEANAGVKLSKSKNLWLDAGVFASHLGFESAISKDCWTLTRSILAENSPYYESGVKISYTTDNIKWFLSGLLLNGWQCIQRPDYNNTPAIGTQVTFMPNGNLTFNYSTFIGNTQPDTAMLMRYFNDFYGVLNFSNNIHLTAGFDYGVQQKTKGSNTYNKWLSPILILKVNLNPVWSVTGRVEYYEDKNGVIITTNTNNGFQTNGYSLNVDCNIRNNVVWRVEARTFKSNGDIFTKDNETINTDTFVTTSIAISF